MSDIKIPGFPSPPNQELVIKTFGIQALNTQVYRGKISSVVRDEPSVKRKSSLGTAIFSDLQFESNDELGDHIPVDTVLFSVRRPKNVVITPISGRDGEITEIIGNGDYRINVKGVICGANGVYPYEAVKSLMDFLNYKQSLGIISKYLNEVFGISEVVIIGEPDIPQSEGSQSYQRFEFDMKAEQPVEILISQAQKLS
jgi:hypothetical protein